MSSRERFGPYTLVRRIATGGTAEIFLARREGVDGFARHCAIKRTLPHLAARTDFVRMLLDEARLAAHLHHGHIVEIHDVGIADGRAYIAMEYLPGPDLGRLLRRASERRRRVILADGDAHRRAALGDALRVLGDVDLEVCADRDAAAAAADAGAADLMLIAADLVGQGRDPFVHALHARHPELHRVLLLGPVTGRGHGVHVLSIPEAEPGRVADVAARCLAPRLPIELAVHLVRAVTDGLDAAHRARDFDGRPLNVVHRDVNPGNVLISVDGAVKLVDFGIARADNRDTVHADGDLVGTCAYMSPEQAAGHPPDARSDLFSVGLLLHEMCTGAHPFPRDNPFATLRALRDTDAPPLDAHLPGVPAALVAIAARALARDPARRYQSAAEMLSDLEEFSRDDGLIASPRRLAAFLELAYSLEERRAFGVSDTGYSVSPPPTPAAPARPPRRSDRAGRRLLPLFVVAIVALAGLYWRWRVRQG